MKQAGDGLPVVGNSSKELGVRVPPNPRADVDVRPDGVVERNGRGMSVVEHWTFLLPHLIPKRLAYVCPDATGSTALACYRLGEGGFIDGLLTDDLELHLKPSQRSSGNVVPAKTMQIQEFQVALAATREEWTIDEEPP